MTEPHSAHPDASPRSELLADRFEDDGARGQVIGSGTASGTRRGGVDDQHVMSIDGGALRIRPLPRPGWGRAALSYGPFRWEPGLTLVVFMLNGHNESQTHHIPLPPQQRLRRVVKDLLYRRFRFRVLKDNLAVGWFERPVPRSVTEGAALIMRGGGTDGGTLRTRVAGAAVDACPGFQNLQTYFVVALRERGAVYYVAAADAATGAASYPQLRPIGVDGSFSAETVHAVVTQSVLGEIDFRSDSRVYGVRVVRDAGLTAAATVSRRLPVADGTMERGEGWNPGPGPAGLSVLVTDPGKPTGLLHLLVAGGRVGTAGAAWRVGQTGGWYATVGSAGCSLYRRSEEGTALLQRIRPPRLARRRAHELQVLDHGDGFRVTLDGRELFARDYDAEQTLGTGVGAVGDGGRDVLALEAHPVAVDGRCLLSLGAPWEPAPTRTVVHDRFDGEPGGLEGRTPVPGLTWRRDLGDGRVLVTAEGARVDADRDRPNPGRTMYTLPWAGTGLADLTVTVTPPGTARWQGHAGRAGVVFWQDEENYLVVSSWLDDSPGHDGSSVSAFYRLHGREEPFDAVWSNVGRDIRWGVPSRLRVCCDGDRYAAWVDDRPVLYRALRDVYPTAPGMRISRVGLAVNWEYGDDTGSVFHEFLARRSEES
jgi:hypothetical protein